jgi:hypothetical protein
MSVPDMAATVSNPPSDQDADVQLESHASDGTGAEKGGGQVPTDFPEGGAAAWAVAIGTSAVIFCTLGYVNSFGYDFDMTVGGMSADFLSVSIRPGIKIIN